jgi:type II secretory pathway component PulC
MAVGVHAALSPAPVLAQAADTAAIYEREVFQYSRAGRPDPFRSLLNNSELGIRVEDLTLRGVVHNNDASLSVAVLEQAGNQRRIRARVGDRIGTLRVIAINPRSIDVLVEELGVSRRATLTLATGTPRGSS